MTRKGDIDCYRHPISQSASGKRAVFHIDDEFAVSLLICSGGFIETLELVPPNDLDGTHMLPTDPTFLLYTSSPHNILLTLASWENCGKLCFVTKFHQSANNFYQATSRQNLLKSNRKFLNTKIEGTEGQSGNGNSKRKQQLKGNSCKQLIMLPALVVLGRV